jgi:hypothetical protein
MSKVRCFACKRWGTMLDSVPRRRRGWVVQQLQHMRRSLLHRFERECAFEPHGECDSLLDLVHTDVCGPMYRVSLSGCEYYLTFIVDHSRNTWIYFLKAKSEVFTRFQEFKVLVENQTGKKIC